MISSYLFKIGKIEWGKNEKISLSLVMLTFTCWALSEFGRYPIIKDKNSIIALGVAAQVIAGIPLTKESWLKPRPIYVVGYLFFILGCILSLILKKNIFDEFITEEHLFPLFLGIQTVIDIIPLIRKLLVQNIIPQREDVQKV